MDTEENTIPEKDDFGMDKEELQMKVGYLEESAGERIQEGVAVR